MSHGEDENDITRYSLSEAILGNRFLGEICIILSSDVILETSSPL